MEREKIEEFVRREIMSIISVSDAAWYQKKIDQAVRNISNTWYDAQSNARDAGYDKGYDARGYEYY